MTSQTKFHLVFNMLGALVGIIVVVYIVQSLLYTETEAACRTRYPAATRMALHMSDGVLMSPIELQARAGVDEYGIHANAKTTADAPGGAAIEVALAAVPDVEKTGKRTANGIFFRWSPPGIGEATSGCLSYMLWLPDDFEFGIGGLLPGIVGTAHGAETEAELPLGMRPVWDRGGKTDLDVATAGTGYIPFLQKGFALPTGRWVRIEQELVLNTTGQSNGIVRLWLDGELKAENTGLDLRKDARAAISGVLADIGYTHLPEKPGTLRITPFEMAWK